MSKPHERIWAKNGYESWGQYGHWYADSKGGGVEYVLADRIKELEAKLAELEPKDGRPCATDEFLAVILDELDDNWDIFEAIKDWVEGDWVNAVQGTTIAELKGEDNE
jgi:hypothetical protein